MRTCKVCNSLLSKQGVKRPRYRCLPCRNVKIREYIKRPEQRKKRNEYKRKRRLDPEIALKEYKDSSEYVKRRTRTDIIFKLRRNLRIRLRAALKRNTKTGSAVKDLGCSIEELKIYLQSKFTEGMSWDNYGKWHIDHIIPLSKVDLTNETELKKAVHYTNLQPLWALDNIRKGAN